MFTGPISKSQTGPHSATYGTSWGNKAAVSSSPSSGRCPIQRSVTLIFLFLFPLILSLKLEARPQQIYEKLKVAPMISAPDHFVDPRLQTADQIVRISRSLEASQPQPRSIQSHPLFRNLLSLNIISRTRIKMPAERCCSSITWRSFRFAAALSIGLWLPFRRACT